MSQLSVQHSSFMVPKFLFSVLLCKYCGIVVAMVHLSFKIFTLRRLSTNIIFTLFCSSHLQTIYLHFSCHHTCCGLSNYSLFLHTSHFLQPLIEGEASPLSCWQLKIEIPYIITIGSSIPGMPCSQLPSRTSV